jgi:hypothetical protein
MNPGINEFEGSNTRSTFYFDQAIYRQDMVNVVLLGLFATDSSEFCLALLPVPEIEGMPYRRVGVMWILYHGGSDFYVAGQDRQTVDLI